MENEYKWKPNDNSSSTRLKYDLEVEHYYRAFKSSERKHTSTPIGDTFGTVALVLSLIINLIVLFVLCIRNLISYLRK